MTDRSNNQTIAVTGAGGFIGSNLVARLRSDGCTVRAIYGPGDSLAGLQRGDSVCDMLDRSKLAEVLDGCQKVVHLAGPPSVARSFQSPSKSALVHTGGTATLLEAVQSAGIDRFVYCSSAEVYGQPNTNPVREDSPMNPLSPYGASKAAAEWIVRAAATANDFEAFILRPFTVCGPGPGRHSLLHLIVDQATNNSTIELMNLAPVRDYVFIADAVDALARACVVDAPQRVSVCNVGTGHGHSVRELAETVLRVVGRNIPIRETGQRDRPEALDIHELVAHTDQSHDVLGWTATTPLENGVRNIVQFEKREIAA